MTIRDPLIANKKGQGWTEWSRSPSVACYGSDSWRLSSHHIEMTLLSLKAIQSLLGSKKELKNILSVSIVEKERSCSCCIEMPFSRALFRKYHVCQVNKQEDPKLNSGGGHPIKHESFWCWCCVAKCNRALFQPSPEAPVGHLCHVQWSLTSSQTQLWVGKTYWQL